MKQPKLQPTRLARHRARRIKAPRYPRSLTLAPPPAKGQTEFDFSVAEKQEGTEGNR
jgi:hypothetical protein